MQMMLQTIAKLNYSAVVFDSLGQVSGVLGRDAIQKGGLVVHTTVRNFASMGLGIFGTPYL